MLRRRAARGFWERIDTVVREFTQLPRDGDTVFGLIVGLHPTDHPSLPALAPAPARGGQADEAN